MNARRFATMTGSLLARKGEASPSVMDDPNAYSTYTTDTLVKQTELRVMAFPKREREVEPATMHFDWPDHVEPIDPHQAHDLRERAPVEVAEPKPDLRATIEPEASRLPRDLRDDVATPVGPRPDLRTITPPAPTRAVRAPAEPERPAEAGERRSFFSDNGGEKRHRMSLGLTQEEHERLGIVAVKKGLTRHQLMRDALDHYFGKLASDYQAECACIATGGCTNNCDDGENS